MLASPENAYVSSRAKHSSMPKAIQGQSMARTKIPVALRLDPKLKAMAEARAKEERRSFAGFLEWLIVEDAKRQTSARQSIHASPVAAVTPKLGK
jgi:hypothetical protein